MSLENKSENDMDHSTSRPRSVEEAVGSHYALQVALQTMKERCQHLQKRLGIVEQENLRLRIENRKRRSDSTSTITPEDVSSSSSELQSKVDSLEEKVAELTRSKSQLTHHLFMVANENKQLWTRLSHLTQANQNLGSHLSKISNTLSRHHSTSSIVTSKSQSPSHSFSSTRKESKDDTVKVPDNPFAKGAEGAIDESLEEISLKLIKSFLQEKTELEDQYAQMVEIQSDSYSIQNLGFEYLEDGDEGLEDLKQHHKNLLELRDKMKEQQTLLKSLLNTLERSVKGGMACSNCKEKTKPKPSSGERNIDLEVDMESLRKWGVPEGNSYSEDTRKLTDPSQYNLPPEVPTDRMCPMCGKFYDKAVSFESFQDHVTGHFMDDEESFSILNNFEVIHT